DFGSLNNFNNILHTEISSAAAALFAKYASDPEATFEDEFEQFCSFANNEDCYLPANLLEQLKAPYPESTFPNVGITLRIYLTLPVTNAEVEQSFSRMRRIKTSDRTTMGTGHNKHPGLNVCSE
ncbi:unnamed protein product, partial [Lepidochelys kempii]